MNAVTQMEPASSSDVSRLIAARNKRTARSASNDAAQRVRELKASGRSIVNLTAGEPDFETPEHIREAAIAAIRRGETRYTSVDGTPKLKEAVIEKFSRENGLTFKPNNIIVGSGAKHVIFNALLATVEELDEVIVPVPRWVSYPDMVRFAGGTPIEVDCSGNNGFKLTPAALDEAITERTKWVVFNTPNNPTGSVYTGDELRALADVLKRHPQVWVLTDDIYEHILFDGRDFETMASAAPDIAHRVLTINGVSKAYAMTGWRIGYAAGPAELISEMSKIQTQSTSNPCSVSQAAAAEALTGPQEVVARNAAEYQARRDLVVGELSAIDGIECHKPDGAFYVLPSCAGLLGRRTASGRIIATDRDLVNHFLDHGVAGIAGAAYGCEGHFRLTTAASREQLSEGCKRIKEACAALE